MKCGHTVTSFSPIWITEPPCVRVVVASIFMSRRESGGGKRVRNAAVQ
jgi:hypothetical protein